jgi:rfaE bifunctional protein kinase chain/domain
VVIGDALLDRDLTGRVDRISPDPPAPVFEEIGRQDRPGGAALAAALATAHGRPVRLITAIGTDPAGDRLRELLAEARVQVVSLPYRGATPEKIRLLAGGRVLLRLDRGGRPAGVGDLADLADLDEELAGAGAVLVSDYGRGVTGLAGVRRALAGVTGQRPVVWDPHPLGASPVPGVRLVTPNLAELAGFSGAEDSTMDTALAAATAERARHRWRAGAVVVTLGASGALLTHGRITPTVVRAPNRATGDSCGAGDRFASAAAAALADGALTSEAVRRAVLDATAFVSAGAARNYPDSARYPVPDPTSFAGLPGRARSLAASMEEQA